MKKVTILGCTGSVGKQALDVIRRFPERLQVYGLAANTDAEGLAEQVEEFRPAVAALQDEIAASRLRKMSDGKVEILAGEDGVCELAGRSGVDVVLSAISGFAGLKPTFAACDGGADLALANKESVVCAGSLLMERVRQRGVTLIPVDSEHNALFQCLLGEEAEDLDRLILTASGGPFREVALEELAGVTPEQALAHPRWDMGNKISIDSATLMNKGLEVLEAHWLFGVPLDRIEVVIHPESAVHSLVRLRDGSIKAHLGPADMRYPVQYALSYPERWEDPGYSEFSLPGWGFTFEEPDMERFPCLGHAWRAGRAGGVFPTVLVGADEVAVSAFLEGRLSFLGIPEVIEGALDRVPERLQGHTSPGIEQILAADAWARACAREIALEKGLEEIH